MLSLCQIFKMILEITRSFCFPLLSLQRQQLSQGMWTIWKAHVLYDIAKSWRNYSWASERTIWKEDIRKKQQQAGNKVSFLKAGLRALLQSRTSRCGVWDWDALSHVAGHPTSSTELPISTLYIAHILFCLYPTTLPTSLFLWLVPPLLALQTGEHPRSQFFQFSSHYFKISTWPCPELKNCTEIGSQAFFGQWV